MAVRKLKSELTKLIAETNDDALLSMVKEDLVFYKTAKIEDVTDGLSGKQLKELEKLVNEPVEKDVITLDEFNNATRKWRTR